MKSFTEIFMDHCALDETGRHIGGTDKASNHSYGGVYDSLFPTQASREEVRFVLEVGTTDGSSMCAWRDAFPNATIVGLDIHPASLMYQKPERLEFHIGDQRDSASCYAAADGRQFDLIVEDATHVLQNTLLTLFWLWPFVKPGGSYVIEEFDNLGAYKQNVLELFKGAEIHDTRGPFGGLEPLVVLRKEKR